MQHDNLSTMNKAARSTLAEETIHHAVPSILSSNARAQKGVQNLYLFCGRTELSKLDRVLSNEHAQDNLGAPSKSHLPIHPVQTTP